MSVDGDEPATGRSMRVFVAVYPPASWPDALARTLTEAPLPPHRPTAAAQLHLTLRFVGEVEAERVEAVDRAVAAAARSAPRFALRPLRIVALPRRGPTRLLALTTEAPPALLALEADLCARLEGARHSAFLPHLTLCRFQRPLPARAALRAAIPEAPALPPFPVDALVLARSVLRATGAEHSTLARHPLAG